MPDHDVKKAQNKVQDDKQEMRDDRQAGMGSLPPREVRDDRQDLHEDKHDLRQERREDHHN